MMSISLLLRCKPNIGLIKDVSPLFISKRCIQSEVSKEREKKIREYVLSRYMQYVQQYAAVLEQKFPAVMRIYRVFTIGTKDFYGDLKVFLAVFHKVNLTSKGFETLTRKELEIYHQMPKDMIKIAPVLLLSAVPFASDLVFPLGYMFPRQLLTSHFWSLQQRHEFAFLYHKKRLRHYKPVLRSLQRVLDSIKVSPTYVPWEHVIRLLGSGLYPSTCEVLMCKQLFAEKPYHLNCLYSSHVKELLKLHGMHTGWHNRKRLAERARLIYFMDKAIIKEGGVSCMSQDDIKTACFFRGLNPANMKREDMEEWLEGWLQVSHWTSTDCKSLLLHCPVLLAYNHPSNWSLLH